jgi:hypothetical protein
MQALLEKGPMEGKPVFVDPVQGRPPKTIDLPNENGGSERYRDARRGSPPDVFSGGHSACRLSPAR